MPNPTAYLVFDGRAQIKMTDAELDLLIQCALFGLSFNYVGSSVRKLQDNLHCLAIQRARLAAIPTQPLSAASDPDTPDGQRAPSGDGTLA